jgi:hypothetical protein
MKLFVESNLPVSPAVAWELFESDEFQRRLEAQAKIRTEVLSVRTEGGTQIRNLRYTSHTELPAIAAKVLGTTQLSYDQENRLNLTNSRLDWSIKLPLAGDRVKASGNTIIHAAGAGSRRVVEGEVTVGVPLVGGQIEKAIVAEFERSMARAVEIVRELIKERGLG